MTPSHGDWKRGSKRRLNSEIAKKNQQTTETTTSSPDSQKNVKRNTEPIIRSRVLFKENPNLKEPVIKDRDYKMGFDKGAPGGDKTAYHDIPAYPTMPEEFLEIYACHQCGKTVTNKSITSKPDTRCIHNPPVIMTKVWPIAAQPKPEPKEVKLPLELIFGFEGKRVKFISEEKINAVIESFETGKWDQMDSFDVWFRIELKKELGI